MFALASQSHKDLDPCYVHSLSPIIKAKTSDKRYFDMMLQTEEITTRAVCFSPEKHHLIKSFEESKSPIKIKNVQKRLYNGTEEYTIQKHSKIQPANQDEVSFSYLEAMSASKEPTFISQLSDVSPEKLVSVKAMVSEVSEPVKQENQYGPDLRRQEVVIVDPSDCITLTLWEENVDQLQQNTTYLFKNVRVKSFRGRMYLNTPKEQDLFSATVANEFEEGLAEIKRETANPSRATGNIIAIQKVRKVMTCISCKKQIEIAGNDGKSFVTCTNCSLSVKLEYCISSWYTKIVFKLGSHYGLT